MWRRRFLSVLTWFAIAAVARRIQFRVDRTSPGDQPKRPENDVRMNIQRQGGHPMRVIAVVLGVLLALAAMPVRADELQVTVASGELSGLPSRDGLVRS